MSRIWVDSRQKNFDYENSDSEADSSDLESESAIASTSSDPYHGSFLDRLARFVPQFQIPYEQATYTVDELCGWNDLVTGEWHPGTALTGDLILMAGDDATSNAVRLFTPSTWSHVAVVMKNEDTAYLLESVRVFDTVSSYRADGVKEYNNGVRIVLLKERLEKYHGHAIAVRHLCYLNLKTQEIVEKHLNEIFQNIQDNYLGLPYDSHILDFINMKLMWWTKSRDEDKPCEKYKNGLFCSSLVAEFFLMAGMMPAHLSQEATCYSPESFSDTGEFYPVFPSCLLDEECQAGPKILEQLGSLAGYETGQLLCYSPEMMVSLHNAVDTPLTCLIKWWKGDNNKTKQHKHTLPLYNSQNKTD